MLASNQPEPSLQFPVLTSNQSRYYPSLVSVAKTLILVSLASHADTGAATATARTGREVAATLHPRIGEGRMPSGERAAKGVGEGGSGGCYRPRQGRGGKRPRNSVLLALTFFFFARLIHLFLNRVRDTLLFLCYAADGFMGLLGCC